MTGDETFTRGQVVWAVWRLFSQGSARPVPKMFEGRIRKLWELGIPIPQEERPGGGAAFEYTLYHCFELLVALMIWDSGFGKFREFEAFVKAIRPELCEHFKGIMKDRAIPVFLVFRLFELQIFGGAYEGKRPGSMVLYLAKFCKGHEELTEEMKRLRGGVRGVIELTGIVEPLTTLLPQAPEVRKGRPKRTA
jgi:hypothetical protein